MTVQSSKVCEFFVDIFHIGAVIIADGGAFGNTVTLAGRLMARLPRP